MNTTGNVQEGTSPSSRGYRLLAAAIVYRAGMDVQSKDAKLSEEARDFMASDAVLEIVETIGPGWTGACRAYAEQLA